MSANPDYVGQTRLAMLDLTLVEDIAGQPIGQVLITWTDVESVRTACGKGRHYKRQIGSIIRTRSGDTHYVAERVGVVKRALDKAARMEDQL